MARLRAASDTLERREIQAGGGMRTYWLARGAPSVAPLVVALHGQGLTGPLMAGWTGLDVRGPQAGFATVFPDGRDELWEDSGGGRVDGLDDAAFIAALVDRLADEGVARRAAPVLAGLSNGAFFAERLARSGLVPAAGIALVAGTARLASQRRNPRPLAPVAVLAVLGTADRSVPYGGGLSHGLLPWIARRRARRVLVDRSGREVVAGEVLMGEWAAVNGCPTGPAVAPVDTDPADPAVQRLDWSAPGCEPVTLYRIEGGGHGWPGGPQPMSSGPMGRIPRHFDATGLVLEFAAGRVAGGREDA